MPKEIKTNQHIYEKLGALITETKGINRRLDIINGQVKKNTDFRQKQMGAYKLLTIIGAVIVGAAGLYKVFI